MLDVSIDKLFDWVIAKPLQKMPWPNNMGKWVTNYNYRLTKHFLRLAPDWYSFSNQLNLIFVFANKLI